VGWKCLPGTNTSLIHKFLNYSRKKFYNIGTRCHVIKLFVNVTSKWENKVGCLSQASLFSLVFCLWVRPGAYPIVQHPKGLHSGSPKRCSTDKQSSLLQTFLNYVCRKFYNNRSRCQCYNSLPTSMAK
jgi:hypothetical protein